LAEARLSAEQDHPGKRMFSILFWQWRTLAVKRKIRPDKTFMTKF